MRVIGGELKGRRLKSIDTPGLRPTTDRVRESIFNILENMIEFDRMKVLDLFAGTGALGIEALSRGAARCDFVDMNRRSVAVIAENLRDLGLDERGSAMQRDALRFIAGTETTYDLVFADPPYTSTVFDRLVRDLFTLGRVRENGLLILEHGGFMRGFDKGSAEVVTQRTFGDTGVTIYRRADEG